MQKPPGNHPLKQAAEQADDICQCLRAYALQCSLTEETFEGYTLLARLRETLSQSKGIVDGIKRNV